MSENVGVDLESALIGKLDLAILAEAEVWLPFVILVEGGAVRDQSLFVVRAPGYLLRAHFRRNTLVLERNHKSVSVALSGAKLTNGAKLPVLCSIGWASDSLRVDMVDLIREPQQKERISETSTPPTHPPNVLRAWLQRRALLELTEPFSSGAELLQEVVSQLRQVAATIRDTAMWPSFWDEHRDGNRIVRAVPKREPQFQPLLAGLLRSGENQKKLSVTREQSLGGGDLDFCVSAPLASGDMAHVCVEVKCAHSHDLVHGLEVQLPAYMKTRMTDLGVYAVFDFGLEYPADLRELDRRPNFGLVSLGTEFALQAVANTLGTSLRVVSIDVSKSIAPSKL